MYMFVETVSGQVLLCASSTGTTETRASAQNTYTHMYLGATPPSYSAQSCQWDGIYDRYFQQQLLLSVLTGVMMINQVTRLWSKRRRRCIVLREQRGSPPPPRRALSPEHPSSSPRLAVEYHGQTASPQVTITFLSHIGSKLHLVPVGHE